MASDRAERDSVRRELLDADGIDVAHIAEVRQAFATAAARAYAAGFRLSNSTARTVISAMNSIPAEQPAR